MAGARPYATAAAFCLLTMIPLALTLKRRPPDHERDPDCRRRGVARRRPLVLSPNALQVLLAVAGGPPCCVAMSMPQVHIVAYCAGPGLRRGARRRDAVADAGLWHHQPRRLRLDRRPGGRRPPPLLLGSTLAVRGTGRLPDRRTVLSSLYLASALFGLFQGGIGAVLRHHRARNISRPRRGPPRVSVLTVSSTIIGMAFGAAGLGGRAVST